MTDSIVLILILLVFVVYIIFKFRRKSGKAPTSSAQKKVVAICSSIRGLVHMQLMLTDKKSGNLPDDDFVIGYIGGCIDATLQSADIDPHTPDGQFVFTYLFNSEFGMKKSAKLYKRFLDNQKNMPSEMKKGLMSGGQEMVEFLKKGSDRTPMGLAKYFLQGTKFDEKMRNKIEKLREESK